MKNVNKARTSTPSWLIVNKEATFTKGASLAIGVVIVGVVSKTFVFSGAFDTKSKLILSFSIFLSYFFFN